MSRPAKPWYRAERDAWYVYINGKQTKLCMGKANRKEAYRKFLDLEDRSEPDAGRNTGERIVTLFLSHAKSTLKPNTVEGYDRLLQPIGTHLRHIAAMSVQPKHINEYLATKTDWGKTSRFNAITAIKRAWSWAKEEGHLRANHLAVMKRPRPERRVDILDDREVALFLKTAKPEFRELLQFVYLTGCRPGEAAMIELHHVKLRHAEVRFKIGEDKTSGKTDKPRVIHLNDEALAMLKRLSSEVMSGPLFRNSKGSPWTRHAMACAVAKIRLRTGLDSRAVVYALRHQWATDALARGVPLSTVAEMMGNSPEIVARVYSHLSDKKALLMQAANTVRPSQ